MAAVIPPPSRMKNTHALTLAALLLGTAASRAQLVSIEPIVTTLVPGQPYEQFFPNEFDPFHPKHLRFEALATQPLPGAVSPLLVWFDWLDLTGVPQTSPPVQYDIIGGQALPIDTEWWLPFCPQFVSLHLEIPLDPTGANLPVLIEGRFTHWCVPEGDGVLASLALLGVAGGVWWRRRK